MNPPETAPLYSTPNISQLMQQKLAEISIQAFELDIEEKKV